MAIKYLYLDDEQPETLEPLSNLLARESKNKLHIEVFHPTIFGSSLDGLQSSLSDYSGVILDWRLDEIQGENTKFPFRAGTVAQELRTRATEGLISDLPIILWSTDEKLAGSYLGDNSSHDLFDLMHQKEQVSNNPQKISQELIALAVGYKKLKIEDQKSTLQASLNLTEELFSKLDLRLREYFSGKLTNSVKIPTHEFAQFILKQCLDRPGVLLNEDFIAAHLGVDKTKSEDWNKLLDNHLHFTKYKGVFSEAWPRWWIQQIQTWWNQEDQTPLSRLEASQRVEKLKERTNLKNLIAASPIKNHYGNRFDTICMHYNQPLEKLDGVLIRESDPLSWQESRYLSIWAVLSREYEDHGNWSPHPIERQRIEELKESFQ